MKLGTNRGGLHSVHVIAAGIIALAVSGCSNEQPPRPKSAAAPPVSPAPEPKPAPVPEKPAAASAPVNPDLALAERVKSALAATSGLNAHRIDITVKDGSVTLFGTAETKAQREAAGKSAAAVTGVRSVENKLAVVAGS
jgi:hyperosmotically inducible protein